MNNFQRSPDFPNAGSAFLCQCVRRFTQIPPFVQITDDVKAERAEGIGKIQDSQLLCKILFQRSSGTDILGEIRMGFIVVMKMRTGGIDLQALISSGCRHEIRFQNGVLFDFFTDVCRQILPVHLEDMEGLKHFPG